MTSKIQQARNEKLLKELARNSENKRCAICTCMGTQFTCQPPGIFICSICAGAMYHFPGHRTKSISMATYTTSEVQMMKEGGNAAFHRCYLAKWNQHSFPAPLDKDPRKVEQFIKQVLVDKVFYSESVDDANTREEPKSVIDVMSRTVPLPTPAAEQSWKAFADDAPLTNSGQSSATATGGNWAEFPTAAPVKPQAAPFDPFAASSSPIHASPKSLHSVPADPFATQTNNNSWEPFQKTPEASSQTGWSQFETKPVEASPMENPIVETQAPTSPPNGTTKQRAPAMSPLPEEWFSVGAAPDPQPTGGSYVHTDLSHQQPQLPFGATPTPYGASTMFPQTNAFAAPQPPAFGYNPQTAPNPSMLASSAFNTTPNPTVAAPSAFATTPNQSMIAPPTFNTAQPSGAPQLWQQQNSASFQQQSNYLTLQKQDSMASYVSHRVDETSHNSLFQNLDMDMRAKAHSVTGVPIQTPPSAFQTGQAGATSFNRPATNPFPPTFYSSTPPTGFDEPTGNPFA